MTHGAAMFDLDGCLVESTHAITSCMNYALERLGLPARGMDELRIHVGPPLEDAMRILLSEANAPLEWATRAVAHYRERYARVSLELTQVVDGIPAVLDLLATRLPLFVVTSKPRDFAVPILEHVGLREAFVEVHGPGVDVEGEPKTVTLQRALNELDGVPTSSVVMIGDRRFDVEAGRHLGTTTVGVTWGAGDRDELEEAGADHVIDEPKALLRLVG